MAYIGELPTEFWGPHQGSDSEKKLNLSLCSRPPNNVAKGHLTSCSNRLKRKARCTCKIAKSVFFFSIYLWGSFYLTFSLPSPSSLLPGFFDVRKRLGIRTRF